MPRFAANLGFSPLEPMKPTSMAPNTAPAASSVSSAATTSMAATRTGPTTDVPAVQFDWNSSGLVNPLDGMKIYFPLFFPLLQSFHFGWLAYAFLLF